MTNYLSAIFKRCYRKPILINRPHHKLPVKKAVIVALLAGLGIAGCAKKEEPPKEPATKAPSESSSPVPQESPSAVGRGFDVTAVPVSQPPSAKFPYVGLIEGYVPTKTKFAKDVPFDKYEFFDGTQIISVEGRLTTIGAAQTGAAAHEVFKTYESLITGLGGVKVYEGVDPKHTKPRGPVFTDRRHRHGFTADRAGVYMLRTPESEIWVEAYVSPDGPGDEDYFLTVVEKQSLAIRASLVSAEEMKKALDQEGHVTLYINFDFNKADIRPDSQPMIDEIAKLLKNDPPLKLTVEGHTDDVGDPDYNQQLSEKRAKSVATAVTSKGVNAARLTAVGHGQNKPIADNATDEGRAKNRRVELVKPY